MSYTPTNWQTGDIVTAEKLNKLESGVSLAGGGTVLYTEVVLDESTGGYSLGNLTYADIIEAIGNGRFIVLETPAESAGFESGVSGTVFLPLYMVGTYETVSTTIYIVQFNNNIAFTALSPDAVLYFDNDVNGGGGDHEPSQ